MNTPEFSVIVTLGSDPDAMTATAESALGQSLRSVELVLVGDRTDADVRRTATLLTARHPDRVRVIDAPPEVRGPAVLRNLGLDAAHGRHVLVLDAGERLHAHALRNLLQAARRTDADLVAGRWTRLAGGGKQQGPHWQDALHARTRTLTDLAEAPELVTRDALVSGFCLRRDAMDRHALRHAEDLSRSEVHFGVRAALAARRITLVPNLIVTHRAPADHGGDLPALLEASGRIGLQLARRGLTGLRDARDRAFVVDHLLPLARSFLRLPRGERAELAAQAHARLTACIDPERWLDLPPDERICVALLAAGDADGVQAAAYALARPGTVVSPLAEHEGRIHWNAETAGFASTDLTELGHQHRPFKGLRLFNRLTRCAAEAGRLRLEGQIVLPLDKLPAAADVKVELELRLRGGKRVFRLPVDEAVHHGERLGWRLRVDPALLPVRGMSERIWDTRIVLTAGGDSALAEVFAEREVVGKGSRFPARPRLAGRLSADTWLPYATAGNHLAFELQACRRPARTLRRLTTYVTHFRPTRKARQLLKTLRKKRDRLHSGSVKTRVYNRLLVKLPVRRGSAVFEAHMGKAYGDSPRAVHEELRARGHRVDRRKVRPTWSYASSPTGFPDDAKLVRRWSWRYLWALARAEFWVDNQGFPHALAKPDHTTYLQTWHGSAYKRMGFDETRVRMQNTPQRDKLQRAVDRFDHFLVRSEHDVRTLAEAYRLPREKLLPVGYPRNDRLVAARAHDEREGRFPRPPLAARLGIPDHKKTVLYAPTFRGAPKDGRRHQLLLDVRRFTEEFGDECALLVRAHYMERAELPVCAPGTLFDVSDHHDVSELLCLADVLVTDYSSIMFDYALLDRPIVLFAPDLDAYAAERGSYFDLRERAPGPVAETEDELLRTLADLKPADAEHAERRREFAAEFGTHDDGGSARAVVDALFGRRDRA
ncbi:bifunctional glycosyltransferase/CDP-glycerol:glycerophosphate glycerophosphotransferase [Streptomyces cavernicola]|uniref:CDP-glycerol glycerophosphotransferase family protein n=1 Tax=Streptomyces cavernicola TaxID=3043613 RepID=A0ABT6SL24_9ACTN|nr:CDP-glycerol glycerophosphotransferase family protein [Streptomyces sp. B-S-A6]MDI3408891.1 CDP-glycerol glycerophosphotransferase family protein [Streptomyces sp. B-S-A6]